MEFQCCVGRSNNSANWNSKRVTNNKLSKFFRNKSRKSQFSNRLFNNFIAHSTRWAHLGPGCFLLVNDRRSARAACSGEILHEQLSETPGVINLIAGRHVQRKSISIRVINHALNAFRWSRKLLRDGKYFKTNKKNIERTRNIIPKKVNQLDVRRRCLGS